MDLEINALFPRRSVFKLNIKHTDADYLRVLVHSMLRVYETHETEHTVFLEINAIFFF